MSRKCNRIEKISLPRLRPSKIMAAAVDLVVPDVYPMFRDSEVKTTAGRAFVYSGEFSGIA